MNKNEVTALDTLNSAPIGIKLVRVWLKQVDKSKHLGSAVTFKCLLNTEVNSRIGAAAVAFSRFCGKIFRSHDIKLSTKVFVCLVIVLPNLLYAFETWCLYLKQIHKLEILHLKCLRDIMNVHWSTVFVTWKYFDELINCNGSATSLGCLMIELQSSYSIQNCTMASGNKAVNCCGTKMCFSAT